MNTISKKYEFTSETKQVGDHTLYRIRSLRDFGDVKAGDLGGFIEKKANLSHEGNCWVYDKALIFQNARVFGNAKVKGIFVYVYGNAKIIGSAIIEGNAQIYDNASVTNHAHICDDAVICDNANIAGSAKISGAAYICGTSQVYNDAIVCGATVSGYSVIHSNTFLSSDDDIYNEVVPEFGSEDDYFRDEYCDEFEWYYGDDNSKYENGVA